MRVLWTLFSVLLLVAPVSTQGAVPDLKNEMKLTARGGVVFNTPNWKASRHDTEVAVLERPAKADGSEPFYVLMLAIEEGPAADKVDWEAVKKNITEAANDGDAKLTLALGDDFGGVEGFAGKRFSGALEAQQRKLAIEILCLLRDNKLVTVSVLTGKQEAAAGELLEAVAKTTKLAEAPPE